MPLSELLRPLLELAEKATRGPYEAHEGIDYIVVMGPKQGTDDAIARVDSLPNASYIAALSPELVKAMIRAIVAGEEMMKVCSCRGTGMRRRPCSMCGDSTYDHYCDDDDIPCEVKWCVASRAAHSELASLLRK